MAIRFAHPTHDLKAVRRFYAELLGLPVLTSFQDHEGFSGIIFGLPEVTHQLEFTFNAHTELPLWSPETLFVLYFSDAALYEGAIARLCAADIPQVRSTNPYWDRHGATFLDPDQRRVVLYLKPST